MTSTSVAESTKTSSPACEGSKLQVYMMDLLPTVPYYTGSLCASLEDVETLRVQLGCITYYLDRDFFRRQDLRTDARLIDAVSALSSVPVTVRRSLKLIEYLINLSTLLVRLVFSRPEILHVQFLPMVKYGIPLETWFLRIVRASGIKVVYTVHNVLPQDTGETHKQRYKRIYQLADRLICHDQCAKDRLVNEFRIDPEKIAVIPHGPLLNSSAPENSASARKKLGVGADQCLVLWQGILRPYKGVSFLLDAWKGVQAEGSRARLAIVGNGDAGIVQEIKDQVATLGLESTVSLDCRFVSVAELADYYSAADVIVYPYREITTSGALMTGIGYGKAIVATRQPAFRQLLSDGENCLMVDYGDVEELRTRLSQVIGDPRLRVRLGAAAGRSYASGPQWPKIATQTELCYREAMRGKRG